MWLEHVQKTIMRRKMKYRRMSSLHFLVDSILKKREGGTNLNHTLYMSLFDCSE